MLYTVSGDTIQTDPPRPLPPPPPPPTHQEMYAFPMILNTALRHPHCTSSSSTLFLLLFCRFPQDPYASVIVLSQLAQSLVRLASASQTSTLRRFACQKTLERIFEEAVEDDDDRVTMIETLLADPDRATRVVGCGLLRYALHTSFASPTPTNPKSPLCTKALLASGVGEYLLDTEQGWMEEHIAENKTNFGSGLIERTEGMAPELTEMLNVLYLILKLDVKDQVRSSRFPALLSADR